MEYIKRVAKENDLKWPYDIQYGKTSKYSCDVLIIGGGMAGCFAAISAAKKGCNVIIVEKGATIRSGAAGAGIDHWANVYTNPGSKLSPDEMIEIQDELDPYVSNHVNYIIMREAYDALLELEAYGVKIRDVDDQFTNADFRDEETKLLYAYDYDLKNVIRFFGSDLKPALYKKIKSMSKIQIFDRVMATSLLNKNNEVGNKVIGATGFNVRTGEFLIFQSKATILCTAKPLRLWDFSTELIGSNAAHDDPNCAGDGVSMAWKAGAELMMMEKSHSSSGGRRFPAYGTGNMHNTWYPCSIVDATGKEIPWVDRDGNVLKTVKERNHPAKGQEFFLHGPSKGPYFMQGPTLIHDLEERIMRGEYKLPFYADLPAMPEQERRCIFGMMIGNEGKTRTPILGNLTLAGFDPEKDMLQANVLSPHFAAKFEPFWDVKSDNISGPNIRETAFMNYGGLVVDWKMMTSIEGLFAAGNQVAGTEGAAGAAASGRYCGRTAAAYSKMQTLEPLPVEQIENEKERIYKPIKNEHGFGWKEVQLGLCRIMQDYCGDYKSDSVLNMGLWWLNSIRDNEVERLTASNPHELARALECEVRLVVGEVIMHQSLARKTSCPELGFDRLGDMNQCEKEKKFITIHQKNDECIIGERPFKFWMKKGEQRSYYDVYKENACLD